MVEAKCGYGRLSKLVRFVHLACHICNLASRFTIPCLDLGFLLHSLTATHRDILQA